MLDQARLVLKEYFGFEDFRPHQAELVEQVLSGRDVLGVMPTGAGKSLVFQIPALMSEGLTLVISPLISLMKDQVDALNQAGVRAACLNSTLSPFEIDNLLQEATYGYYSLLYVAPERLTDTRFTKLCNEVEISLVAVDEAHCISQWGKDFRPSYTRISDFVESLEKRPRLCALTATATDKVRDDIVQALKLNKPYICVAGFDRQNLYFGVERPRPAQKNDCLLRLVRKREARAGIIYCSTRAQVEEVWGLLHSEGFPATYYHAGLSDEERRRNQDDFLFDRKTVMVATNAFGMGIDKSNVSYVIHYNMPRDLESYYQEAGRAGRDGSKADCILIYNKADVQTVRFFAECGLDERAEQGVDPLLSQELFARDLERIQRMTIYCTTTDCLRSYFLRYFGETQVPYRCENCSSCAAETETLELTEDAQKIISCVLRLDQRNRSVGKAMIVDILRGSQSKKLLDSGFETLSTYGLLKDVSKDMVYTELDALIAEGHLRISESKFPVVTPTQKGIDFIKSGDRFELTVAKKKLEKKLPQGANSKKGTKGAGREYLGEAIDQELFEKLRQLRYRLAQEQQVAAFIIFSDKTLNDMCLKLPQTYDDFLEVSGVGKNKADKYSEDFLAAIAGHEKRSEK